MRTRLTALLLLAAGSVAVAIGPGVSLVRCELTGRVALTCCCAQDDAPTDASQLRDVDDCCRFVHLDASWQRSSVSSKVDIAEPPTAAPWSGAPSISVAAARVTAKVLVAPGDSPPAWLSTRSLRI